MSVVGWEWTCHARSLTPRRSKRVALSPVSARPPGPAALLSAPKGKQTSPGLLPELDCHPEAKLTGLSREGGPASRPAPIESVLGVFTPAT
jgi:hypothetical protein